MSSLRVDINEVIRIASKDLPTKPSFTSSDLSTYSKLFPFITNDIQRLCISNYLIKLLTSHTPYRSFPSVHHKPFITKMFLILLETILTDSSKLQNEKLMKLFLGKLTSLYAIDFFNQHEMLLYVKFAFILGNKSSTIVRYALILFNMIINVKHDNVISNEMIFNIVKFIKDNLIAKNNQVFLLSKLLDINDLLMFDNVDINKHTQQELTDLLCHMNLFQFRKKFFDELVHSTIVHFDNVVNTFTPAMNAKIQLLQKLFYLETEHITKDAYNFLSGFYFPSRHKEGIELSKFNYTHENIKNFSFVFSFKSIIKTEEKVPLIELCELDNKGKRTGHVILRVYIEKNALYIEGKKDMKFPSNTKSKEQIIPIASNCSYLIIGTLSKQKNAIRLCAVKTASKIDLKDMNFKQFPSLNTYFSILIGSSCTLQHTFSGYMGSVLLFNMFFTDDDIDALISMKGNYDALLYSDQNCQYIQKEYKKEVRHKLQNLLPYIMGMVTTYGIKDFNREKKLFKENAFDLDVLNKAQKYFTLAPLIKPIKTKMSIYEFVKYEGVQYLQLHCEYYMQVLELNVNKQQYYDCIVEGVEGILLLVEILINQLKLEYFDKEKTEIHTMHTFVDVAMTKMHTHSNQIVLLFSDICQLCLKISDVYMKCPEALVKKLIDIGTLMCLEEDELNISLRNKIMFFLFNKAIYTYDTSNLFNYTCEKVRTWLQQNNANTKAQSSIHFLEVVLSNKTLSNLNNNNYIELIDYIIKESLTDKNLSLSFYLMSQLLSSTERNEENIEFAYKMNLILYNTYLEYYLALVKDDPSTSFFQNQSDIIRNFILNEINILQSYKTQQQQDKTQLTQMCYDKINISEGQLIQMLQLIDFDGKVLSHITENITEQIPLISLFLLGLEVISPDNYADIVISTKSNLNTLSTTKKLKVNYVQLDKKIEIMVKLYSNMPSTNPNKALLKQLISRIVNKLLTDNYNNNNNDNTVNNSNNNNNSSNSVNKQKQIKKNKHTKDKDKRVTLNNIFQKKTILYTFYLSWEIDSTLKSELELIITSILPHIKSPFIFKLLFTLFIKCKNNAEHLSIIYSLYAQMKDILDKQDNFSSKTLCINLFRLIILMYKLISLANYERDVEKKKEKFIPLLNLFHFNETILNCPDIVYSRIKFKVGSLPKHQRSPREERSKWKYISEIIIETYIEAYLLTKEPKYLSHLQSLLYVNNDNSKTVLYEVDQKIIDGVQEKGFFAKLFAKAKPVSKVSYESITRNEHVMEKFGKEFTRFTNISFLVFYFLKFSFYALNKKKHDIEGELNEFYGKIRRTILDEMKNIKQQINKHKYEHEYDETFYQKFKVYMCSNFSRIIPRHQKDITSTNSKVLSLSDIDDVIVKKNKKEKYKKTYNDYFKYDYDKDGHIRNEQNEIAKRNLTRDRTKTFGEVGKKESRNLAQFKEYAKEFDNDTNNVGGGINNGKEKEEHIFADFISSREELLLLISNALKQTQTSNDEHNQQFNLFPYCNTRKMFLYITFADYFKDKVYSNKPFELLIKKYKEKFFYTYFENEDTSYLKYPSKTRNYFTKTAKTRIFLKPDLKFFTHPFIQASHVDLIDDNFPQTSIYSNFTNRLHSNINTILSHITPRMHFKCELITISGAVFGDIYLTSNYFMFISSSTSNDDPRLHSQNVDDKMEYILSSTENDIIPKDKSLLIRFDQIEQIFPKRFLYSTQAFEMFLKNRKCYYFNLFSRTHNERCLSEIETITSTTLNHNIIIRDFTKHIKERQNEWLHNKLSTFNYISILNFACDRSFNDVNQYPIFPWLTALDTNTKPSKVILRNFIYPVSIQLEEKRQQVMKKYQTFQPNKHGFLNHFNSHYSAAAFLYFYLVRVNPFAYNMIKLQAGEFDNPNRIFHSFYEILEVLLKYNDNRELIPELFYFPEMFINLNFYNLGTRSGDKRRIHNLLFEDYYDKYHDSNTLSTNNPVEFMCRYRRLLESNNINSKLHHWIDNVFGVNQFIKDHEQRLQHCNTFHKYSYAENVSLEDKLNKMYTQHLANDVIWKKIRNKICCILNFGQCPKRVFTSLHPQKQHENNVELSQRGSFYKSKSNLQLPSLLNDFDVLPSHVKPSNHVIKKTSSERQLISFDDAPHEFEDVLSFNCITVNKSNKKYFVLQKKQGNRKQLITYTKYDTTQLIIPIKNFSSGLYHVIKRRPIYHKVSKSNSSFIKVKNVFDFNNTYAYFTTPSKDNGLYIFTNYYDNSIKCYFENQKQPISFVTSSYVTVIKKINKKEFITGHENGMITHWMIIINDTQTKQSVSLFKKKSVISQRGAVLCINFDIESSVIITGNDDGVVSIRNIHSFQLLNVIKPQNTKHHQFLIVNTKINKSNGMLYILGYNKHKDTYSLFGYTINGVRFSVLDNIAGSFQILNNGLIMCYSYGEKMFVVVRGENLTKFKTKIENDIEGRVMRFYFLEEELRIKYLKVRKNVNNDRTKWDSKMILGEMKVPVKCIVDINREEDTKEEGKMSIWDSIEYESDIKIFSEDDCVGDDGNNNDNENESEHTTNDYNMNINEEKILDDVKYYLEDDEDDDDDQF